MMLVGLRLYQRRHSYKLTAVSYAEQYRYREQSDSNPLCYPTVILLQLFHYANLKVQSGKSRCIKGPYIVVSQTRDFKNQFYIRRN